MITLQQDLFQTALNAVTRASGKSGLQAVFALAQLNVTTDGILHLSCFNGETAARATVNVDCNEDLAVCVDAATFKAVVETLTGSIRLRRLRRGLPERLGHALPGCQGHPPG